MVYCAAYNCASGSASGWNLHSFPQNKIHLRNTSRVPTCHNKFSRKHLEERMFVISPSMARSVGYEMESVRLTEDAIPTILDKLGDANSKRISGLMEKLNRKWVCMSDNRIILGANYWTFTSSHIRQ